MFVQCSRFGKLARAHADISQDLFGSVKTRTTLLTVHVLQTASRILYRIDVWMCAQRLFLRSTFSLVCLYAAITYNDDLYYVLDNRKKSVVFQSTFRVPVV